MADKPIADAGMLPVWKAKYAALGRLIESYEEAERIGALGGVFDPQDPSVLSAMSAGASSLVSAVISGTAGTPTELPVGAFLNMSIPEAIKLYLSAVKRKQTAREIAAALKDGGMESTAANWETTVTGALHRLKTARAVLRFKDGWGLADFYPESLRNRITKDAEPKKKRGRPKKATKNTARREPKAERRKEPAQPGLQQRIDDYLQTRGSEYTTVQELAAQLKVAAPILNLALGRMAKTTKIERNQDGRVRLVKKAA